MVSAIGITKGSWIVGINLDDSASNPVDEKHIKLRVVRDNTRHVFVEANGQILGSHIYDSISGSTSAQNRPFSPFSETINTEWRLYPPTEYGPDTSTIS